MEIALGCSAFAIVILVLLIWALVRSLRKCRTEHRAFRKKSEERYQKLRTWYLERAEEIDRLQQEIVRLRKELETVMEAGESRSLSHRGAVPQPGQLQLLDLDSTE